MLERGINYAEKWQEELTNVVIGGLYSSPFINSKVKWLDAKVFHFTSLKTSGFKDHVRDGGWNRGSYTQKDTPYVISHDRNIEFRVDKADVMETNETASVQNIATNFVKTNQIPEMDAVFFSKVAQEAIKENCKSETDITKITSDNVVKTLRKIFRREGLNRYKAINSLVAYVRPEVMDALETASDFKRVIDVTKIAENKGIETRITYFDGVHLIEVIDTDRFYTKFDFAEGFKPAEDTQKINILVCSTTSTALVSKIESIYFFSPGEHTESDGFLYQHRSMWDAFTFPNALNDKIDSIFVDVQPK
ncbi:MAG: phage capsid protein [Candidatus Fimenecus sp.]